MRYVLDASVAVAALRPTERNHVAARAYVSPLLLGVDETIVPAIFRIELGPERARRAQRVATATRLRAADSLYVWLAMREGIPLVTLDHEIAKQAPVTCQVVIP